MTTPAITTRGLRKTYGSLTVLDGIDLDVPAGTVFSLLGPNGAGKTTAVNILTTLIRADAGQARVAGWDVVTEAPAVRAAIGVTGQFSAVDPLLTGAENLTMMGNLAHLRRPVIRPRVVELLERFDLAEAATRRAGTYSGGMTRRLDLAMSLISEPSVLFLDEPTTGLDPRSRRTMWHVIQGLAASGVTVFLTTQYLDEADELADRVALLDHGRVVADGTPDELKRLVPGGHVSVQFTDLAGLDAAAHALGDVERDRLANSSESLTLQFPSDGSVASLRSLLDRFDDRSIAVAKLSIHTPDLDDVFFALTGRTAEKASTP